MQYKSSKFNGYIFNFKKVNVLLGANGAGKSTFLSELLNQFQQRPLNNILYVEGGRTIRIRPDLRQDDNETLQTAIAKHNNKRRSNLADRVIDGLKVLEKKGHEQKINHSDNVNLWINSGKEGECPIRKQPPLDLLFEMFNEIFPLIELTFDSSNKQITAHKNQIEYSPSQLSDGEKQVFSILVDFIDLPDSYQIIIIDEPELNLHPELAERLWSFLENEYPKKTFIYASHSINFALRDNVETVHVLSNDSENITLIDSFEEIERSELKAFLGGLPGILSANKVVVTEGHEKSFDSIFYRWLLEDNSIEIYPGGGCADVVDIVSKSGLWGTISTKISLIGIIDSDYRSSEYLESLKNDSILSIPYHEAESFLCIPEVITEISSIIGSQEEQLNIDDVREHILNNLKENKLKIAAKRLFTRTKITLGVSLTKRVLNDSQDKEQLMNNLKKASKEEIRKASDLYGIDSLEPLLQTELDNIDKVIEAKDVDTALYYLPGKGLLNSLAPKAGCKNGNDLMRSLRRNCNPRDFANIDSFRENLNNAVISE